MNDIINEFGYLKPGTSLEKEDSIRLLKVKPSYSGKDASDDEFFNTWGFTKDNSDVADYFNSYLDSQGFKRIIKNLNEWWESRHPYRKYYSNPDLGTLKWFNIAKRVEPNRYINKMSTVYSESIQDPTELQRFIIVGSYPTPYWVLPDYPEKLQHHPIAVLGHEYAHGKAPFSLFGATHFNPKSAQAEALDLNTNTKPGHDSRQLEKHADLWGLKYLLYKEGIYDSRSNKDITEEEIQKLRKKYPNLRPLKLMTDKQLMFMLNHVAMNNVNTDRPLMVKKGNKLISKHQTGKNIFQGADGPTFDNYTKKWYNTKGEEISQNHKYKKDFGYTMYTKDGYAVNYDNSGEEIDRKAGMTIYDLYVKKENNLYDQQTKKSYNQRIPFIKDKLITLTNAGKLTGAKLSTNMLDSLAKYGAITGLPILSAIGLAGQETTFGTLRSENEPYDIDPKHLVNDHAYYSDNPYNDLIGTARRKALKVNQILDDKYMLDMDSIIKLGISYAEKQIPEWKRRMNIPVLQHAFTKYKLGTYNIGDPNHTKDVEEAGEAAFNSPEIQHWWNTEGYKWYK